MSIAPELRPAVALRLLQATPDAVIVADVHGRIRSWNARAAAIFGWTADEAIGRDLAATIVPEALRAGHEAGLARFRRTGESTLLDRRIEVTARRRDGSDVPVELSLHAVPTGEGPILVGFARDLTDRKSFELLREIDAAILAARTPEEIAGAAVTALRRVIPADGARVTLEAARVSSGGDRSAERRPDLIEIPLIVDDKVLGCLSVSRAAPGAFSAEHVQTVQSVGDRIAVALSQARLNEEVRAARRRLEARSASLLKAQEGERRRIARELHDEMGQLLTGLKLTLQAGDTKEALLLVDRLIAEVRTLSFELRPAMLDDLGLLPALVAHIAQYMQHSGIRVSLEQAGIEGGHPPAVETAAFRIIQEALTNAARHALATRVTVRLWGLSEALHVQVEDNGRGFDPVAVPEDSPGIAGMRERAALLGGALTIDSAPGVGARVTASLPLAPGPERP